MLSQEFEILSNIVVSKLDPNSAILLTAHRLPILDFETLEIAQQDGIVSKNPAKYIFQTDKKKEQRCPIFFPRNI